MDEETDDVPPKRRRPRPIDRFDRRILGALIADARRTFADIGRAVGLSAPAVHERVGRLKAEGVLRGMTARIDAAAIGKPFLAFVHVDCEGWGKGERMMGLLRFPEVEEMHSVAGDASLIMKVRTAGPQALEHLLAEVYALPGVRGTRSYVVLSTFMERPAQAEVTLSWPSAHPGV
jgi:Lrp/AsnC family transcriptional regulator, leucine-responsive regulatory protein